MSGASMIESTARMKLHLFLVSTLFLVGCGSVRQREFDDEVQQLKAQRTTINDECRRELDVPDIGGALRGKVEVWRTPPDAPIPFEVLSNDMFPTSDDQQAIRHWAVVRDKCVERQMTTYTAPPHANRVTRDYLANEYAVIKENSSRVGSLIVALFQQKLTYAEFARKRLEIGQQETQTLRAMEDAQRERDEEAVAAARDRFNQSLMAWGTYLQGLQARQPQTVYVSVQ
jgi:hypothetical protein